MAQTASNQGAREAALARRRAMTSKGKAGLAADAAAGTRTRQAPGKASAAPVSAPVTTPSLASPRVVAPTTGGSARSASRQRRLAMSSGGKAAIPSTNRTRAEVVSAAPAKPQSSEKTGCGCGCGGTRPDCDGQPQSTPAAASSSPVASSHIKVNIKKRNNIAMSSSRAASLARRAATSSRGKSGLSAGGMSPAQAARATNPQLSSRELATLLREQRSRQGKSGQKKSEPCGRVRPKSETGAAQDAPWKVGVGETASGQTVTGTMVGRSQSVTGDEPSTCRPITGTEYLGADIFREFCQAEPAPSPAKVISTATTRGNQVTGNKVGRGQNVTGDEPGTCKRVSGIEYVGADQSEAYCGVPSEPVPTRFSIAETSKGKPVTGNNVGRSSRVTGDESGSDRDLTGTQYMQREEESPAAPAKVGSSATLRGGSVTGTMTGRSEKVTGDEPGSCRGVTGDDYVGQEQFSSFCEAKPAPQDQKVGVSATLQGETVTGTMTGRSGKVTGDEPGTCKSVTGTPYAGAEQFGGFCEPGQADLAARRSQRSSGTPGSVMTGVQPGAGSVATGDDKGACEDVTGTPYVGADQFAAACPATAADTSSPDFPQALGGQPWGQFSVVSPAGEARQEAGNNAVTGNQYEQGQITGPFDMAPGKVTGTEEARFGQGSVMSAPAAAALPTTAGTVDGRVKSRITGEGQDAGNKITGDDWDRGDNVTGTEGASAAQRNPTLRGVAGSVMPRDAATKRNEELPTPVSKVTGGSGNTEKGSLITYSGGARG